MITGFGNNIAAALASDITSSQTTFNVAPGAGDGFAKLLTTDFNNPNSPHRVYAKLTLTDSQQTVFEICHLTAVSNDSLTVLRGQEGTAAKGWSLNDVVANFATRGSEQSFVQIEQLQAGDFTSATAGGTPNALTAVLPSTFFNNNSSDWVIKTPIVITPIAANTGSATLQITLGGRVIGTFPLYKGNKTQLAANDILKDVPLICVMDGTKTFLNVANPGAIYAGLGTAAFRDVQTSKDDITPGRVLVNGGALAARSVRAMVDPSAGNVGDANDLPGNAVSFVYSNAPNSPTFTGSLLDFSGVGGGYNTQIVAEYNGAGARAGFRTRNGDTKTWNPWNEFYHTGKKPTASDVNAIPDGLSGSSTSPPAWNAKSGLYLLQLSGASQLIFHLFSGAGSTRSVQFKVDYKNQGIWYRSSRDGFGFEADWSGFYTTTNKPTPRDIGALPSVGAQLNVNLNTLGATTSAGVYFQGSNANATPANNYPIAQAGTLLVTPSAYGCQQEYTAFGTGRKYERGLSGPWNGNGPWGAWNEYLLKANLDAYTKAESNARYVAGVRLGARGQITTDGTMTEAPRGCVITGGNGNEGNQIGYMYYRPLQQLINGAWVTVAYT